MCIRDSGTTGTTTTKAREDQKHGMMGPSVVRNSTPPMLPSELPCCCRCCSRCFPRMRAARSA
eukprot:10197152-Alexandrium_andersonii.AAC.1